MKRRVLLFGVLAGVLLLTGGFFIWEHFYNKTEASASTTNPLQKKTEPNYPKAQNYEVPILMYHYIRNAENETELGQRLSVSPENFQKQIAWLKSDNYQTIKLADLADPEKRAISKIIYQKQKPIILTFDDGYKDAFTQAFPVLKNYGFTGTFFLISDFIGQDIRLSASDISQMEQSGMEFGSHTLTHPDLTKINSEKVRQEIFDSKNSYQVFCYPSGKYNEAIVAMVKEAGYLASVTTHFGIANQNSNLFELPRVRVENGDGQFLKNKIESAFSQSQP